LLLQVHLRDEEPHVLLDVAAEHGTGTCGNAIAAGAQPGLETAALRGRENDDVVFADGVLGLDRDAERLGARVHGVDGAAGHCRRRQVLRHLVDPARVLVEVLDQPRRGIRVDVVDE
jgi:hypothetical protein